MCWDFDWDSILVKMDMFITMFLLPIHEHGRSHHLILSSFNHMNLSLAWLELLQDIFYYLWRVVFPWFLFSVCHLHIGTLLIFFFELILYSATLLGFFGCRCSLVEFWDLLMYTIIPSANNSTLTSSFLIFIPLISFSCLIVLNKTTSTTLSRYLWTTLSCS